jgi:hypothetical protein
LESEKKEKKTRRIVKNENPRDAFEAANAF